MTMFVIALVTLVILSAVHGDDRYGIVVDLGTFGSRTRLYKWTVMKSAEDVLNIAQVSVTEKTPGMAIYFGHPQGRSQYLKEVLGNASVILEPEDLTDVTLYMRTTGVSRWMYGHVREDRRTSVIDTLVAQMDFNPFNAVDYQITSGNQEAYYNWLAVNYLEGFLNDRSRSSVGVMELSSNSLQVAYIPVINPRLSNIPIDWRGQTHMLYATSFPLFGWQSVAERIWLSILVKDTTVGVIKDPCSLKGDTSQRLDPINGIPAYIEGVSPDATFQVEGTGDVDECINMLTQLLSVDQESCFAQPCAMGGIYQAPLPDVTWYALGSFRFAMNRTGTLNGDGSVNLVDLSAAGRSYCQMLYEEVAERDGMDEYLSVDCTMALYYPLLFKAMGFDVNSTMIIATDEINGQPADWTLGAMIFEETRHVVPDDCPQCEKPNICPRNLGTRVYVCNPFFMSSIAVCFAIVHSFAMSH